MTRGSRKRRLMGIERLEPRQLLAAQLTTADLSPPGFPRTSEIVATDSKLFFDYDDNVTGNELWVADLDRAGSRLVKDLSPGLSGTEIGNLTPVGSTLYFTAKISSEKSPQVFRTDGTETGTRQLTEFQDAYGRFTTIDGNSDGALKATSYGLVFVRIDGNSNKQIWLLPFNESPARPLSDNYGENPRLASRIQVTDHFAVYDVYHDNNYEAFITNIVDGSIRPISPVQFGDPWFNAPPIEFGDGLLVGFRSGYTFRPPVFATITANGELNELNDESHPAFKYSISSRDGKSKVYFGGEAGPWIESSREFPFFNSITSFGAINPDIVRLPIEHGGDYVSIGTESGSDKSNLVFTDAETGEQRVLETPAPRDGTSLYSIGDFVAFETDDDGRRIVAFNPIDSTLVDVTRLAADDLVKPSLNAESKLFFQVVSDTASRLPFLDINGGIGESSLPSFSSRMNETVATLAVLDERVIAYLATPTGLDLVHHLPASGETYSLLSTVTQSVTPVIEYLGYNRPMTLTSGAVIFKALSATGYVEVWRTDGGTTTRLLKLPRGSTIERIGPPSQPDFITATDDVIFFLQRGLDSSSHLTRINLTTGVVNEVPTSGFITGVYSRLYATSNSTGLAYIANNDAWIWSNGSRNPEKVFSDLSSRGQIASPDLGDFNAGMSPFANRVVGLNPTNLGTELIATDGSVSGTGLIETQANLESQLQAAGLEGARFGFGSDSGAGFALARVGNQSIRFIERPNAIGLVPFFPLSEEQRWNDSTRLDHGWVSFNSNADGTNSLWSWPDNLEHPVLLQTLDSISGISLRLGPPLESVSRFVVGVNGASPAYPTDLIATDGYETVSLRERLVGRYEFDSLNSRIQSDQVFVSLYRTLDNNRRELAGRVIWNINDLSIEEGDYRGLRLDEGFVVPGFRADLFSSELSQAELQLAPGSTRLAVQSSEITSTTAAPNQFQHTIQAGELLTVDATQAGPSIELSIASLPTHGIRITLPDATTIRLTGDSSLNLLNPLVRYELGDNQTIVYIDDRPIYLTGAILTIADELEASNRVISTGPNGGRFNITGQNGTTNLSRMGESLLSLRFPNRTPWRLVAGTGDQIDLSEVQSSQLGQLEIWNSVGELVSSHVSFPSNAMLVEKRSIAGRVFAVVGVGDETFQLDISKHAFQNPLLHQDVTGDGRVTASDALIIVNRLHLSDGKLNTLQLEPQSPDVNGDGQVTAADALEVLHWLNQNPGSAEAEPVEWPCLSLPAERIDRCFEIDGWSDEDKGTSSRLF